MKLGLGLYRHLLTAENFRFARQLGAEAIVAHLTDYFAGRRGVDQPVGGDEGWGRAGDPDRLWSVEELLALRRQVEAAGLELAAIENFDPAHWHDVLLDGPRRHEHIENCKTLVRRLGEAGIPALGYNFSLAGVASRITGAFARGEAVAVGMNGVDERPVPPGMVWNMIVGTAAAPGMSAPVTHGELWRRLQGFLQELVPVAEASGVRLAAHPDDPPSPMVRGTPRLVYQPQMYQRLLDLHPSRANGLEFCVGTIAEMTEGDVYEATDTYSRQGAIVYVHLRNVRGKVPTYRETFIDDGDVDAIRILRILHRNGFDGVVIPDHTPQVTGAAPWHTGMAFALGYLRAAIQAVNQ